MSVVFAVCCALVYGVADYCGGRASRSTSAFAVTVVGQTASLVIVAALLPVLGDPSPSQASWAWAAGAGVFGAAGLLFFYSALASGAVNIVAPISAVVSAVVPAAVGLATGERPGVLALVGVLIAVVAIALVSGAGGRTGTAIARRLIVYAFAGGLGFGMVFVMFERTDVHSGLWPLLAARCASIPVILVAARTAGVSVGMPRQVMPIALVSGVLDMAANLFYLLAVRRGLLTIVSVVAAMYPASTVLLAYRLDGERSSRLQVVGFGCVVVALTLVITGRP